MMHFMRMAVVLIVILAASTVRASESEPLFPANLHGLAFAAKAPERPLAKMIDSIRWRMVTSLRGQANDPRMVLAARGEVVYRGEIFNGLIIELTVKSDIEFVAKIKTPSHTITNIAINITTAEAMEAALLTETLEANRRLAARGDSRAHYAVGLFYLYGWGVSKDYREAAWWLREASLRNVPAAANDLGVLHATGQGARPDSRRARTLLCRAARAGVAEAHANIALLHAYAKGTSDVSFWSSCVDG